jgi:glycerol-3-phosphate dehydrogenase (NAD(P)+)
MSVTVIGSGSWATALVKLLCNHCDTVHWWFRNKDTAEYVLKYGHNPRYLQSVEFNREKIQISTSLHESFTASNRIIIAVPAAFLHTTFEGIDKNLFKNKIIFSAIKGMVPEYDAIPARYFHKSFEIAYDNIGIICGPCHAEEVAMERLSYLTIGCQEQKNAEEMARLLACRYIKTAVTDDLFGTELSAVLKNIYAIAAGIYGGLGYGDNFQAVFISNALREMETFIDVVNPTHRDVKSSAYLGDLLVTAYSKFSRNRTFGYMIGQGYSVKTAQLEMQMVAEGYYAVKSVYEINKKFNVNIPIVNAVYNILYEKIAPAIEMKILSDKLS